jgi:hypothetical protein
VTGAVIGEWTASSQQGLGTYLLSANSSFNVQVVFGVTLLLTAIGVLSFLLVMAVESVATPWRSRSTAPCRSRPRGPQRLRGQAPGSAAEPSVPAGRGLASTGHEQ